MKSPFEKGKIVFKLGGIFFLIHGRLDAEGYLILRVVGLSGWHAARYRNHHVHIRFPGNRRRVIRLHPTCRRQVELREQLDCMTETLRNKKTKGIIKVI